jgi:hypothetical protein
VNFAAGLAIEIGFGIASGMSSRVPVSLSVPVLSQEIAQ